MFYPTFMYHLIFFIAVFLAMFSFDFEKKNVNRVALLFILFLTIIGGLRGDFTTDYSNYASMYDYIRWLDFSSIWDLKGEKVFILFNYLFGRIFESPVPFFVFCMALILLPIYWLSCKSSNVFIFLLLYLSFGYVFSGFNVMREVVAASLFVFSFEFLKEGKFVRYILLVLFLSTIHISALFMLPFYFLLRLDFSKRNVIVAFILVLGVFVTINSIMSFFDLLFFNSKYTVTEVDKIGHTTIMSIVVPSIFFVAFYLLHFFNNNRCCINDLEKMEKNISLNSCFYWIVFYIFAQKFPILIRFSYFFFPFVALLFTNNLIQYSKNERTFLTYVTFCFCVIYYFAFGQYYKEFYFFWQQSQL